MAVAALPDTVARIGTAHIAPRSPASATRRPRASRRRAGQHRRDRRPQLHPGVVHDNVFDFVDDLFYVLGMVLLIIGKPLDAWTIIVISPDTIVRWYGAHPLQGLHHRRHHRAGRLPLRTAAGVVRPRLSPPARPAAAFASWARLVCMPKVSTSKLLGRFVLLMMILQLLMSIGVVPGLRHPREEQGSAAHPGALATASSSSSPTDRPGDPAPTLFAAFCGILLIVLAVPPTMRAAGAAYRGATASPVWRWPCSPSLSASWCCRSAAPCLSCSRELLVWQYFAIFGLAVVWKPASSAHMAYRAARPLGLARRWIRERVRHGRRRTAAASGLRRCAVLWSY